MSSIRSIPHIQRLQRVVPSAQSSTIEKARLDLKNEKAYLEHTAGERVQFHQQSRNAQQNSANAALNKLRAKLNESNQGDQLLKKEPPQTSAQIDQAQSIDKQRSSVERQAGHERDGVDLTDNDSSNVQEASTSLHKEASGRGNSGLSKTDLLSAEEGALANPAKTPFFLEKSDASISFSAPKLAEQLFTLPVEADIEKSIAALASKILGELKFIGANQHTKRTSAVLVRSHVLMSLRKSLALAKRLRTELANKGVSLVNTDYFIAAKLLQEAENGCPSPQRFSKIILGKDQGDFCLKRLDTLLCLRNLVRETPESWWPKSRVRLKLMEEFDTLTDTLSSKEHKLDNYLRERFFVQFAQQL